MGHKILRGKIIGKPTDNLSYKIIGTVKTREIKDFLVDNGRDSKDFDKLKDILGKVYDVISINYLNENKDDKVFIVDEYVDDEQKQFLFIHNIHVQWYKDKKEGRLKSAADA